MKAGEEIPFMLVRPFGPFIVKSELPQELMDDYNEELEKIVKDKKKVKELDWSPHLVGKVKHELRVPENLRKKYDGYFEALVDAYVKKVTDNPEGKPFKLGTAWYVRQFPNDFNPIHIHTYCSLSSVGYLKLPKGIEKEFKSEAESTRSARGHIEFVYGTPQDFNSHTLLIEPKVGDFYIFPRYLMHTVYPFKTPGERRSFSMNVAVKMEEN
tara:strand:+ start:74 stop:709 length:636 start_codon:yes stop_codon:yes gene_type:complete